MRHGRNTYKRKPRYCRRVTVLGKTTAKDGTLSPKTKELIALGIAISIRCEGCIACHVGDAILAGATHEDIVETIGVAVLMGGGPSIVFSHKAYEAMEEFLK